MSPPETSGLQALRALIRGELPAPSIGQTMGLSAVEVDTGRITLEARPDERHLNPAGAVHGGFAATCLDGAAALALLSTLDATTVHSTIDLGVKYLRPLKAGQTYRVFGRVVERTRSIAICDAEVVDDSGRLHAKGTCTFLIKD
ncbi:PaaI family thioesterase [Stenotrophomonas sp. 24(2023)]|uniref:PaaI family thioesterase n=1 Tax=Stenotrophomonas sp. 24(2023) TaxID=3068324 RepID=UPI0027E00C8B|nr:PaaI family thioesterase [Stenotrophomonas sp. 24(2023)]WMJ68241.1 PaaI family thioesterase [Stenotrophomonas sp. 24(2023)]